jgi:hypothetical protein
MTMKFGVFSVRLALSALAIFLVSLEVGAGAQRTVNPALVARAEQVSGDRFRLVTRTPQGVNVLARTPRVPKC